MPAKPPKAQSKERRRRKGRPGKTDVSVGKEAIIEATRILLRTLPPAKVTRTAVAQAAGIDPGLVRYYFGDITSLLTDVAETVAATMRGKLEISAQSTELSPGEKLRQRVRILLETFVENPHFHELFVELILYRDRDNVKALRRSITQRSHTELEKLLRDAGSKADSRFAYIALFGILEFFVTGRPVLEELYPTHVVGSKRLQNDYADFVSDLLFRDLKS